jgi:hypothetical protein
MEESRGAGPAASVGQPEVRRGDFVTIGGSASGLKSRPTRVAEAPSPRAVGSSRPSTPSRAGWCSANNEIDNQVNFQGQSLANVDFTNTPVFLSS